MENTLSKTMLYVFSYITLMIAGYLVGLITLPKNDYVVAIKQSTVSIENAPVKNLSIMGNAPEYPLTRELNPFSGGKVIDFANPTRSNTQTRQRNNAENLKKDPRITMITQDDLPLSEYNGDTLQIEIPGQDYLSNQEQQNIVQNIIQDTEENIGQTSIKTTNMINTPSMFETRKMQEEKANTIIDPYAPRQSLAAAPNRAYLEKANVGFLPKTPKGQQPLWSVYSNKTRINNNKKPIAFIIGGLGTDQKLTMEAIKTLPSEVTLGFIPYVNDLQNLINLARKYGHETILELPMESHDFPRKDAGLLALKVDDTNQQYTQKLETLLSRASGYSGTMNYLGSKYLSNDNKSMTLLQDLKARGLYFVENKTLRVGIMSELANFSQVPYAASYSIIDEILSPSLININLDSLEKNVLKGTPIIGTAYLSRMTLSSLQKRIKGYKQKNDIQLIPISAYVASHDADH
ncbi:MAG: polysaccharide deacetylase 2 family uncharacterized protein YibQ [Alphaproteobacteria bacterium]|jgi:polysaccharide deacetylase 2 family uncharacterized protein YibQ